MIVNPYPRKKMDFEGIDGSGKSLQHTLATQLISKISPSTLFTKEPWTKKSDGSPVPSGTKIYDILQGRDQLTVQEIGLERFQIEYYFPNRVSHFRHVVIPALESGRHVISDRGPLSVAYGAENPSHLMSLMAEQVRAFGREVPFIWADAVLLYDVPAEEAMRRLLKSGKCLDDHEKLETLQRVRENYLALARVCPNIHVIDGSLDEEGVWRQTRRILFRMIG